MTYEAHDDDDWVVEVLGPCRLVNRATTPPTVVQLSEVQRLLVASLFVAAPGSCSQDDLCDLIWRHHPPPTARAALQNQISRIRRRSTERIILTGPNGYSIGVPTDAERFRHAANAAEIAWIRGDHEAAFSLAERALGWWRSRPLPTLDELEASDSVTLTRRLLDESRRALENVRLMAGLAVGRAGWAVREAERLIGTTPLDEGRWVLLVQALHAVGRRGDALAAVDRARRMLRKELGLDVGPSLRAAEAEVLEAGPPLDWAAASNPLRGRDDDLRVLVDHMRDGAFVVVTGERGIGRSAVLKAIGRTLRAEGYLIAEASATANPSSPLALLNDIRSELGLDASPGSGVIQGFVRELDLIAQQRPLVLLVDDVMDVGPSSLHALIEVASHPNLAVIVTSISLDAVPDLPADSLHHHLKPLDDASMLQIARDRLEGFTPDAETERRWLDLAGGNPFLLGCHMDDVGSESRQPWTSATTGNHLAHAVQWRIDQLGVLGRRAVETAAVCGAGTPAALVAELSSSHGLSLALATGVLREVDGCIVFAHGAMELGAYHGMAESQRKELHLRLAQRADDAATDPAVAARHWLAVAELEPLKAARAAQAAARSASRQGAHRDAARWFERSLTPARHAGDQAEIVRSMIGLGDELRLSGHPDHAEQLMAALEVAEALGDLDLLTEAVLALAQLGAVTEPRGTLPLGAGLVEGTLQRLEQHPDAWARVAAVTSVTRSLFGRAEDARRLFVEAEARAQRPETRLQILPASYLALGRCEDLERRERLTDELLRLAVSFGDPIGMFEAQHLMFSNALQRADGPGLRRAVTAMGELVEVVGDTVRRWQYLYALAARAHLDGDLEGALRLSDEAYTAFTPISQARAQAVRIGQMMAIRLAQRDLASMSAPLKDLLDDQPGVVPWHALFAATVAETDPALAIHHATYALDHQPRDFTWLGAHLMVGHAAAVTRHETLVNECHRRLEPWAGRVAWQGTCAYGPVAGVLAPLSDAMGEHEDARRYRNLAKRLAASLETSVFLHR